MVECEHQKRHAMPSTSLKNVGMIIFLSFSWAFAQRLRRPRLFLMELVYGAQLRLPEKFFSPTSPDSLTSATDCSGQCSTHLQHLRPFPPHQRSPRHVIASQDLDSCMHVFLRHGQSRRPLTPAYDGPFQVMDRRAKTSALVINEHHDVVSIDRGKPAYLASLPHTIALLHLKLTTDHPLRPWPQPNSKIKRVTWEMQAPRTLPG